MWRFDAVSQSLVWVKTMDDVLVSDGSLSLGTGDLQIDAGSRDNTSSIIDEGLRLI